MKYFLILMMMIVIGTGCDNVTVEEARVEIKYNFSSHDEFIKHYLPLQDDYGGVKS